MFLVDKQLCKNEDEKCLEQRRQLEQIRDLSTSENIQFAISTNIQIAEKQFNIYGSLPKLCFFRDSFPIIYSGKDIFLLKIYPLRFSIDLRFNFEY